MKAGEGRALGRVLLTGSEGFVGRALAARLNAMQLEVVVSDIAAKSPAACVCDLTDAAQVEALFADDAFSTVLHCGAVSGPMVLADDPHLVWRINAQGTANLLEAARRHRVGRVVLCSTTDVYGETSGRVDEATLPSPCSVYAASKLAAEHAGAAYAASFGMDVVSLRIAWVYGPGRRTATMLETALNGLLHGEHAVLDVHPTDPAHYLHLDDAVRGILASATAGRLTRAVYNVAPESALTMGEVAVVLADLFTGRQATCARDTPGTPIPHLIAGTAALVDFGFSARVPLRDGLAGWIENLVPSTTSNPPASAF